MGQVTVAAAVIVRNGKVLIAKKRSDQGTFTRGMWEFPGGKVEEEESIFEALRRELHEELDVEVRIVRFLASTNHLYRNETNALQVRLFVFLCRPLGEIEVMEHEEIRWINPDQLRNYALSPADKRIVPAIIEAATTF